MTDTNDPNFVIQPAPGFIYVAPEQRALVRPALDVIRAPARDALHLAARLAVYVATTAAHDAEAEATPPSASERGDWGEYNRACVTMFLDLFGRLGGAGRPHALLVGTQEHLVVAVSADEQVIHVDPSLGLWVHKEDGTYGTLANWLRGEATLLQTVEPLCVRMPYRGVHLERAADADAPIALPPAFADVLDFGRDALRAALNFMPAASQGSSVGLDRPPLDPASASLEFHALVARLHAFAPSTTVFTTWLNTLVGVTLGPQQAGVCEHEIVDDASADLLWSQGAAICGARVNLLRYAISQYGIPTRNAGFLGLPYQGDHSAIEVMTDGAWRFFDPTFGIYLASPEETGTPLSLAAAHSAFPSVAIMAPVQPFWTGFPKDDDVSLAMRHIDDGPLVWAVTGETVALGWPTYFYSEVIAVGLPLRPEARLVWDLDLDGALRVNMEDGGFATSGQSAHGGALHTLIGTIGPYAGVDVAHAIDLLSQKSVELSVQLDVRGRLAEAEAVHVCVAPRRHVDRMAKLSCERRLPIDLVRGVGTLSFRILLTPPVTTLRLFTPLGKTVGVRRLYIGPV